MEQRTDICVLIVDDEVDILEMVSDCLLDLPCRLLTAKSPGDAEEILTKENVAVFVSDLNLENIGDGNKLLARVHAKYPDIVTVLMSGAMDRDAMIKALNDGGVWRYVEKPIDPDVLSQVVHESLGRYDTNKAAKGAPTVVQAEPPRASTPAIASASLPPPPPQAPTASATDLSKPHERFPFWDRSTLYDRVTGMYMDCWDDAEIAKVLSEQLAQTIAADLISSVRKEAAIAGNDHNDSSVRRRWIYRYRILTVNNLVKEYMFMEQKPDFLQAKRELAEEIEALVQQTAASRLWVAVNDALGRNNIGMELVHELLAYRKTSLKIDALVEPYAASKGMTLDQGMKDIAGKVSGFCSGEGLRDSEKIIRFAAKLLNKEESTLAPPDISYLVEYERFSEAAKTGADQSFMTRIMRGADIFIKPPTVMEQVLGDMARDFSVSELSQLIETIKSGAVLPVKDLERIKVYVAKHLNHIEMRRELIKTNRLENVWAQEAEILESMNLFMASHIELMDYKRFFAEREVSAAAKLGITASVLQAMLDVLNQLPTFEGVVRQLQEQLESKTFAFPAERYCIKRFGQRGPFGVK